MLDLSLFTKSKKYEITRVLWIFLWQRKNLVFYQLDCRCLPISENDLLSLGRQAQAVSIAKIDVSHRHESNDVVLMSGGEYAGLVWVRDNVYISREDNCPTLEIFHWFGRSSSTHTQAAEQSIWITSSVEILWQVETNLRRLSNCPTLGWFLLMGKLWSLCPEPLVICNPPEENTLAFASFSWWQLTFSQYGWQNGLS